MAREFWVSFDLRSDFTGPFDGDYCCFYSYKPEDADLHMVEFSEYERVCKELESADVAVWKFQKERNELKAQALKLAEALKSWLSWEEESIKETGPYAGDRINELINNGNATLAEWKAFLEKK